MDKLLMESSRLFGNKQDMIAAFRIAYLNALEVV